MSTYTQDGSQQPSQNKMTPGQVHVQRIHNRALRRVDNLRASKAIGLKTARYEKENKIWYEASTELEQAVKFGLVALTDLPQAAQDELNASESNFTSKAAAAATGGMSDEQMTKMASAIAVAVVEGLKNGPKDDD